ncbi:hypothetical protein DFH09DRAFT_1424460 [Mycena vulgaris]|nr:hypothetical protein DFH09DRAFT_1424460 [Mycena vulgaris]
MTAAPGEYMRHFLGLVPQFLGVVLAGDLPKLTTLWFWLPERALLPANDSGAAYDAAYEFLSVQQLWEQELWEAETDPISTLVPIAKVRWREYLHAALEQLESLRVGFGPVEATDVGLLLGTCDPEKLIQFGFEWNWRAYGHEEPISPALLAHLARFPSHGRAHSLSPPRRGALLHLHRRRAHHQRRRGYFRLQSICRVGIGNSVVWERHYAPQPSGVPPAILLVSDGSYGEAPWVQDNGWTPGRPKRGPEIKNLLDLMQRILE